MANSLLINFARTAVYLRNDITNSVNIQIADIFIEAFDHDITNNEMCEKIKDLKVTWAEGLIYDSSNEAFGDEDEKKCRFLYHALDHLRELLLAKQFDRAYDFADVLHVFPDVRIGDKKSCKAFWKIYVRTYEKRYHDNFFEKIKEVLTAHQSEV